MSDDMGGMAGFDWQAARCHAAEQEVRRLTTEIDALRAELARMREPLNDDAILHGFCKTPHTNQFVGAFKAGVRFAEAAHGITAGKEG